MSRLHSTLATAAGLAAVAAPTAIAATPFEWSRGEMVTPTTAKRVGFATPALALSPNGSAAVAWARGAAGNGPIEVVQRIGPAAGFGAARRLSNAAPSPRSP